MKIYKTLVAFALFLGVMLIISCQATADQTKTSDSNSGDTGKPSENRSQSGEMADPKTESEAVQPKKKSDIDSIYTDLAAAKCKTLDSNEEEQWISQECPGVGGYKIEVTEGDLRQTINLISPGGTKLDLNFQQTVSSGFSELGEKAEWRVKNVDGKPRPFALIVRFNVSEDPEDSSKLTSYLIVSKITGDSACVTDVVKPVNNANEKARQLADDSGDKACKN